MGPSGLSSGPRGPAWSGVVREVLSGPEDCRGGMVDGAGGSVGDL